MPEVSRRLHVPFSTAERAPPPWLAQARRLRKRSGFMRRRREPKRLEALGGDAPKPAGAAA